jgi:hypothetical protein
MAPAKLRRASTLDGQGQPKSASNRVKDDHGSLSPNVLCLGGEQTGGGEFLKIADCGAVMALNVG